MENTLIYQALLKNSAPVLDVGWHIENLFKYPENVYFRPTNSAEFKSDDYSICMLLGEMHLIEMLRVPIWYHGSFRGIETLFLYSKSLQYTVSDKLHSTMPIN